MSDGRWKMLLCASCMMLLIGCRQGDDTIVYQQSRRWVEKTVAVVAPTSADVATKARFERTAQWFLDNLHQAQLHDTLCIELKLEWHDELTEDLARLGETLADREDVLAVIGPFGNDGVAQLAPACQQTHKPVIAPTATSEDVIRRFAVGTAGVANKEPFLWSLTETDITFCEVLMSMYASYVKSQDYDLETSTPAAMFSPDDSYGRTFFDWGPYQAEEMGIPFSHNDQYTDDADLRRRMKDYLDELSELPGFGSINIGSFCVIENTQQLYDIARVRMEWWDIDPDEPMEEEGKTEMQQILEFWGRTYFAYSNLTQESLDALGQKGADILQYYQGFSPYADPTTGFEKSYEVKFGTKPTFAECKFYDALMLAAFAASYAEHQGSVVNEVINNDLNKAIITITTPQAQQLSGAAWSATSMELYLNALEQGRLMGFKGASGDIRFDSETFTSSIHTTYVHWQIKDGKLTHQNYLSSDGSHRTGSAMAAWSWLVENAEEAFANEAENKDAGITYPALSAQYAILVQGSNGWNNYRHQADVLNIYQMLKKNGYDDEHIILIIDKALGTDSKNPEPSVIRAEDGGTNLLDGSVADYDNADIIPDDICNILLGVKTDKTPIVLPKDAGQNVLFFWSGHGHNRAGNGVDELTWRDVDIGYGMTANLLRQTISQMQQQRHYRKMLVLTEPCFSEAVITPLVGIPGVLAMSSAGTYEQSFADNWSSELGVWRCDRFSHNLVTHLTASPSTTYRDLYLYCAQHTLGSHVHIVNSAHFGNLYTTGPQEFFDIVK
ncbi:MAG: peptidase C13 [Bacteroidaceae bacterium]|nr:peptidase C13 [Bacteroidaceae bacterium]